MRQRRFDLPLQLALFSPQKLWFMDTVCWFCPPHNWWKIKMALIATRLDAKIFLVVTPPPFSPSPYQYLTISPDNLKTSQTQNRMLALFTTPTTVGTTLATAWEWREGGGGGGGGKGAGGCTHCSWHSEELHTHAHAWMGSPIDNYYRS